MADAAPVQPVLRLMAQEQIVIIGDSITAQNLYAAYIETFLISRLPTHCVLWWNLGWGGDTAPRIQERFARDVAPRSPTLVLINVGMNDGCYGPYQETLSATWLTALRAVIKAVRACNARPVLLTTSATDPTRQETLAGYNGTLARFARQLTDLATTDNILLIDIFTVFLAVQERAQRERPGFTMVPDGIHPDAVGHLVMAYAVLRQIHLPHRLGSLRATPSGISAVAGGAMVVRPGESDLEVVLELPFIPFFVPAEARAGLALMPFQGELNDFTLVVEGWPTGTIIYLSIDDTEVGQVTTTATTTSFDLALLDHAPWNDQGSSLWRQAQQRFTLHGLAWRGLGLEDPPEAHASPAHRQLLAAMQHYLEQAIEVQREICRPRSYRLLVGPSQEVPVTAGDLSPLYPFDGSPASFRERHPPEIAPLEVPWTPVTWSGYQLDLTHHFTAPRQCVCYLRVVLEASTEARLRVLLGSDDGLSVFLNDHRLLAHDVYRGCTLGDETMEWGIAAGRTTVLLRVTQGGGGYAVALRLLLVEGGPVRVAPRP